MDGHINYNIGFIMARNYGEDLEKKYTEEALDQKAKVGIQSNNYNCSLKAAKV